MDRSRLPANRSYRFVNAIFGLMLVAAAAFRSTKVCAFPVPREYQHMQRDLYKFLERARDLSDVETTHRSYTMCQGVFQVFRRRLTIHQAIQFSNTLPAGIRALFTAEWEPLIDNVREGGRELAPPPPFPTNRGDLVAEVRQLRSTHNFAPDTAIEDVAKALRECLESEQKFDQVLEELGPGAQSFWECPKLNKDDERRIAHEV